MSVESADEDSYNKMQECSHCSKTFKYRSERIRHEMSHSASFQCETCSKKFNFISALRRHEKQHKRKESIKCVKCKKEFRDSELLKRHINYSHKVTLPCPECSSIFHSEQALQTHMKCHKPLSERKYKCTFPYCTKSFNFSHHLKHHELTHTNAKQHYCAMCGKGFIQFHHLKEHLKSHDETKSIKCDMPGCVKKFSTEYARKRHKATHRVKPDSGISSDSNSCDASISPIECKEFISCASCSEWFPQSDLAEHAKKCHYHLLPLDNNHSCNMTRVRDEITLNGNENEKDVGGCNTAVGGCLMRGNSCVCAQIPNTNEENYDFTPIVSTNGLDDHNNRIHKFENRYMMPSDDFKEVNKNPIEYLDSKNNTDLMEKYSEIVVNYLDNDGNDVLNITESNDPVNTRKIVSNFCEGCECASTCNVKVPSKCNRNINNSDRNNIVEYRIDGVVKIKDTFDIDIAQTKVEDKIKATSEVTEKSVDLASFACNEIIGKCIAEESCLCARMMRDEQQAMAQEIDDITPVPKTDSYISVPT